MSGGYFDYKQYAITGVIEELEECLAKGDDEFYHVDDIERFRNEVGKAIYYLNKAQVYTQRIDWLLSGDDGEGNFYERLEEDLSKIKDR